MSARFVWDGVAEMKRELRKLPEALTREAQDIVDKRAVNAASTIHGMYLAGPYSFTGNLAAGVGIQYGARGRGLASVRVVSNAPHAHLIENGTAMRFTDEGAYRGIMRPQHIFVPTMMREREAMWGEIALMLVKHGLEVSGYALAA